MQSFGLCCHHNLFQTTYTVTAFATAEEYHLESLAGEAKNYGYSVVQLPEGILIIMQLHQAQLNHQLTNCGYL